MIIWLFAAALALPPEGLVPDAVEPWADTWQKLFDGPEGCWEVTGRADWKWDLGRSGSRKGAAAFVGKLDEGVWRDFYIRSLGEIRHKPPAPMRTYYPHNEQSFVPLFGHLPAADADVPTTQVLQRILDEVSGPVGYAISRWDDDRHGVVLQRTLPIGDGANPDEATMDVFFPGGGTTPQRADIHFPEAFPIPDFKLARIRDAKARVVGTVVGDAVFPSSETFSFAATLLGFRMEGAQTITYRSYRPCGLGASEETRPVVPGGTY